MASLDFSWTVTQAPAPGSGTGGGGSSTTTVGGGAAFVDPLGSGIVRPFRRTETADFDHTSGVPEVMSCIGQLLGTPRGTFPWRPGFGSDLTRLRHRRNDPTVADIGRVLVEDALRKWEPRAQLVQVRVEPSKDATSNLVTLSVSFRLGASSKIQTIKVTA